MRIFVPPEDIVKKERVRLSADKAKYLISVLRSKKGDKIDVIDGRGKAYNAYIAEISKKHAVINILQETHADIESAINLILCQGILKGEKMDLVIQKATELGVNAIVPVITERCVVKETRKVKRWQKITEEAAEQCGRTVIPKVHEPVELGSLFMNHGSQMNGFIFWEEGGISLKEAVGKVITSPSLHNSNTPIFIVVGPEGGFTAEEVKLAERSGLIMTTLGRRILRAETAAIVSAALVQFLMESAFSPDGQ
ncbi:MAG: 16S rRNA (uracil(1498)-N(3))-methyltransferase [Nitrospirae bacterium]|nr:16S rRNA (uracil(1498)-N(3))-methyltransferase [Nitrospirota bacterium]